MRKKSRSKTRCSNKQRRFSFVSVRKGARRLSRWMIALALLPLLWGALHQTGLMLPNLLDEGAHAWAFYAAGVLSYILIERFLARPMWLYVFGHELTHALTGVLSGAKVHSFKAKSTGGEVRLSKSNAFIALSPYVVPLYALAIILVYAITRHWWNPPQLVPAFQFVLGLTMSFHISLTISAIHKHQPDLKVLGFFLSGVLICLGNVLMLALLGISLFVKTPSLTAYGKAVGADTLVAWQKTLNVASIGMSHATAAIKEQRWIP